METDRNSDGTFGKGNKGKPKGAKSERTKQWDALADSIVTTHAGRFNDILEDSGDEDFADLFLKALNYFKPKQNHNVNEDKKPIKVIFQDVSKKDDAG